MFSVKRLDVKLDMLILSLGEVSESKMVCNHHLSSQISFFFIIF